MLLFLIFYQKENRYLTHRDLQWGAPETVALFLTEMEAAATIGRTNFLEKDWAIVPIKFVTQE